MPNSEPTLTTAQQQALQAAQRYGGQVREHSPPTTAIHVHFHPDWLVRGTGLLALLCQQGRYQSQFESGSSNGSYSPEPQGERWQWEDQRFAGAYNQATPGERPVYGAVDLEPLGHPGHHGYGAAPRFGSAYLQLHSAATARSSFCDPDSFWHPRHTGLWQQMDWQHLQCLQLADPLDHYVEAQVHGGLLLARDVAAIWLDPCYASSPLAQAVQTCGLVLRFHPGYRLHAGQLAQASLYRGAEVAEVLADMLEHAPGCLTPADVGQAHASGRYPAPLLKKAWHCLAQLGRAQGLGASAKRPALA